MIFYLEKESNASVAGDGKKSGGSNGSEKEAKKEIIIGTTPVVVGRNDLDVNDKRCSRKQVTIAPESDGNSATFTVTAHGVNPSLVAYKDGSSRVILRAGDSAQVSVGDKISLLCDGTHTFVLKKREKAEVINNKNLTNLPKWSWLDDDGWVEYSQVLAGRLESAFKAKEKECPVDAERFVDFITMEQKRRDNPTKRRKVKREEVQKAIAAVIHVARYNDIPYFLAKRLEERKDVRLAKTMGSDVTHVVAPKTSEEQEKAMALLAGAESHGTAVLTYQWLEECARSGKVPDAKKYVFPVQKSVKVLPPAVQSPKKTKKMSIDSTQSSVSPPTAVTQTVRVDPGEYVVWLWRDDDGNFKEYNKAVSDKIERAYQITGPNAPETVDIGGKWYVDLNRCVQRVHGIDDIER